MILINLLPPELRRARRSGVNPVILAAAAGILLVLATAGTWAWIELSRVRTAQATLAGLDEELVAATARADKVREIDKEISAYEALHGTITNLITRKVFWARTLDDFAGLLAQQGENRWTIEGYEVRCTGLTISPVTAQQTRGKSAGEAVTYSFRANFKIVGDQRDQAGDYVKSFFQSVDLSRFWREHGFVGHAEDPFRGDTPRVASAIGRVVTEMPLEWRRVKVLGAVQGGVK